MGSGGGGSDDEQCARLKSFSLDQRVIVHLLFCVVAMMYYILSSNSNTSYKYSYFRIQIS